MTTDGAWADAALAQLSTLALPAGTWPTLDAVVAIEMEGRPAVAVDVRQGTVHGVAPADEVAADYRLVGTPGAWLPLVTGEIGLAQALNAAYGGLRITGDVVRAAGDMWTLANLLATWSAPGGAR